MEAIELLLKICAGAFLLIILQVVLYMIFAVRFRDYAEKVNRLFKERSEQKEKERNSGK